MAMKQLKFSHTVWFLGIAIFQIFAQAAASNSCPDRSIADSYCNCYGKHEPEQVACRGIKNIPDTEILLYSNGCEFHDEEFKFDSRSFLLNGTIYSLDLSCGSLTRISSNDFASFYYLQHLDLSLNQIIEISGDAFHNLVKLNRLDLSQNNLSYIHPLWFTKLDSLSQLSFSGNLLQSIPENAFNNITSLHELNLSNNLLSELTDALCSLETLKHLDLSHNQITSIDPSYLTCFKHLKSLNLSHNLIKEVSPYKFPPNLKYINLAYNMLITLDERVFEIEPNKIRVQLKGNPLDCKKWFVRNQNSLMYQLHYEVCLDHNLVEVRPTASSLALQTTDYPICLKCGCRWRASTLNPGTGFWTVNCSNQNFNALPPSLPPNTRIVYLENNRIRKLIIPPSAEWDSITRLYLANNFISSLKELEGTALIKNIRIINLARNNIKDIPIYILDQMTSLEQLYLGGNPWKCDCENTLPFQMWISGHSIPDIDELLCAADGGPLEKRVMYQLPRMELCPQPSEAIHYLDVLNGLMAVTILLIIVKVLYDYWGQKRTGKLPEFFRLQIW